MQYEQVTRRDWERTALYLAGGMLLIMTAAIFLFAINRVIGVILWLALIGVVLAILVNWHTKMYAYKCKRCGEEFEISPLTNFVSPQGFGKNGAWKYLKCPRCDQHEHAEVFRRVNK
jgi:DNA-directed RNA polymerase subunit RPC12/RpoP